MFFTHSFCWVVGRVDVKYKGFCYCRYTCEYRRIQLCYSSLVPWIIQLLSSQSRARLLISLYTLSIYMMAFFVLFSLILSSIYCCFPSMKHCSASPSRYLLNQPHHPQQRKKDRKNKSRRTYWAGPQRSLSQDRIIEQLVVDVQFVHWIRSFRPAFACGLYLWFLCWN